MAARKTASKKTTSKTTTRAAKKAPTKPVNPASEIVKSVQLKMKKEQRAILDLQRSESLWGVKHLVSTGLPNLDLLAGWRIRRDGKREWGFPTGRFNEVVGDSATGKTLIANMLLAKSTIEGGFAAKFMSERDIDEQWYANVLHDLGVDEYDEIEDCMARTVTSSIESPAQLLFDFNQFATKMKEVYEPDGSAQFSTMVVDSIAEVMGNDDLKTKREATKATGQKRRLGEDGSLVMDKNRPGNHAKGTQEFIKMASETIHRYNILFLFLNQHRANMEASGAYSAKYRSAHEASMQYANSVRLRVQKWGPFGKIRVRGKERSVGDKVQVSVIKKRSKSPLYDQCILILRPESVYDQFYSMIDAMVMTGLCELTGASGTGMYAGSFANGNAVFHFDRCEGEYPGKEELTAFLMRYTGKKLGEVRQEMVKDMSNEEDEFCATLYSRIMDAMLYLGPLFYDSATGRTYNETKYHPAKRP